MPANKPNRRWLIGLAIAAIVPAVLLVDIVWVRMAGWRSTNSTADVLVGLCAVALLALAVAAARPRGRAWLGRMAPRFMALGISLGLSWIAAEWVAGRVFGGQLLFHRHTPGTEAVFRPNPEDFPGVTGDANYTANSQGIRGPEFADDDAYRVLCVGGSTTACLFLDDSETWPHLVGERCAPLCDDRLWVGDVGVSGYGSWHHVRLLEQTELLEQVDCVVFLVGINDYMRALQGRQIETPFDTAPLFERSNLYAVAHNWYAARKQAKQHEREFADGRSYVRRRALRREAELLTESPDLERGLAEYRTNLETIVDRCRELDLRVIVMTQPVLWRAELTASERELLWLGMPDEQHKLAPDVLADGMTRFNDVLRDVAQSRGIECVDLDGLNGRAELFYDDCHFTEAGAQAVADALAARFEAAPPRR